MTDTSYPMDNTYTFADLQQARVTGYRNGFSEGRTKSLKVIGGIVAVVIFCACLWVALFI